MTRHVDGSDELELSKDELAVAAELRSYAAGIAPEPSDSFAGRVLAAVDALPHAAAARSTPARGPGLAGRASMRVKLAFGQLGGASIPIRVRVQAGAFLVVVALIVTASVALAAAGASSVASWVSGPQSPFAASHAPSSPTLTAGTTPSGPRQTDHPKATTRPLATGTPGQQVGSPSPSAGSVASDPGATPTAKPDKTKKPANSNKPSAKPKST